MKCGFLVLLLLVPVFAATLSSPSQVVVSGNQTFTVSVFGATPGSRMVLSWKNDKLDIFPGMVPVDQSNLVSTIHVFPRLGTCGKTNLTITLGTESTQTELDLGECDFLPGEFNTDNSYLGNKMWELKDEIDKLEYYLQMTPELQDYIDNIYARMAEANSIDITVSQAEYTRKDILVHEIESDINKLDLSFRGINPELVAPGIVEFSNTIAEFGNTYLMGKVEEHLGEIKQFNDVLLYKRQIRGEMVMAGQTKDFSMFKVVFYNPTNIQQKFLFAEDIAADVYDINPSFKQAITIWNITLNPKQIKTLKYLVYQDVDKPVTSLSFKLKEPEPTCSDGIRNQDETDVDCGGACPPCEQAESVATCFDGIWNQGEQGVDCGGPCSQKCPEPESLPLESADKESEGIIGSITSFFSSILQPSDETQSSNKTSFFDNYLAFVKIFISQ